MRAPATSSPGRSATGLPQVTDQWKDRAAGAYPYAAVLPLFRNQATMGALVLVGDARDPFTALDDRFLVALGQQVGAALENTDLYRRLEARTVELARLSARMIEQHEEERRRLSRELHDETGQVFSAVRIELGVLRDGLPPAQSARLDQVLGLIDKGIRSIRSVTNDLRPSLLDDLGLLPALRSLVAEFGERSGMRVELDAPAALPPLSEEAELALFRALQEALSNVLRHAQARSVDIGISVSREGVLLEVRDDGRGPNGARARGAGARGPHGTGGDAGADRRARGHRSIRGPARCGCAARGAAPDGDRALVTERRSGYSSPTITRSSGPASATCWRASPGSSSWGRPRPAPRLWSWPPACGPTWPCSTSPCPAPPAFESRPSSGSARPRPRCSSSACTTTPSTCWRASGRESTATCSRTRRPPSSAAPSGRCGGASRSSARPSRAG